MYTKNQKYGRRGMHCTGNCLMFKTPPLHQLRHWQEWYEINASRFQKFSFRIRKPAPAITTIVNSRTKRNDIQTMDKDPRITAKLLHKPFSPSPLRVSCPRGQTGSYKYGCGTSTTFKRPPSPSDTKRLRPLKNELCEFGKIEEY